MQDFTQAKRILFNGDSTTDCCRDRSDRHSLAGYSKLIQDYLTGFMPNRNIECFNRAISGDRTKDLLARIESDIADTNPDCISMLIGINDVWRRYDANDPTDIGTFAKNLESILAICKKQTDKVLVLEPFLMRADAAKACFREDLDPKIQIERELARKYGALYVPLDGLFAALEVRDGYTVYSGDGVHPAEAGNAVIARAWLQTTGFFG